MRQYHLSRIIFMIVILAFISGCSEDTKMTKHSSLKIGVLRIDDSLPLYVAEKDQLFQKYGADVELIKFGSASDQSKAMEAGELDGMMTDMIVQNLIKKGGIDVKTIALALGATEKEGRFLVVSSPHSSIVEPKQLVGQSVMISENTMMDYLMEQYERHLKLDSSEITKIHLPNLSLRVDTVLAGKEAQAAILPEPLASYAVAQGANIVIDDTTLGENFSQSVIVMTQKNITENRAVIENFLSAYNEAIKQLNQHPEKYFELALKVANVPEILKGHYAVPVFTPNCVPAQENVERISDWLVSRGLLDKAFPYEDLVETSLEEQ
ncbi:ABC transporter substrate-binding protein [Lysinibacillus sp. NPDC086135]|uniref:ABC transporter substrate-binding protein n=1 Tax=Lysinibacillus sp. NPDC086135 TaxID=3364130 RepID=UPI003806E80D